MENKLTPEDLLTELVYQVFKRYSDTGLEIKPKYSFTVYAMCQEIVCELQKHELKNNDIIEALRLFTDDESLLVFDAVDEDFRLKREVAKATILAAKPTPPKTEL